MPVETYSEKKLEKKSDEEIVAELETRRLELGDAAPRFGLFLFGCDELQVDAIRKALDRIPEAVDEWLDEVVVMLDKPSRGVPPVTGPLTGRPLEVHFHRPPRDAGYGAARKAAFEYAHLRGFDRAIVMRVDATHPPERLPELILTALDHPGELVLVTRRGRSAGFAQAVHSASRFAQNHILGLRLRDCAASFRLYPVEALRRMPFQLNGDGTVFDSEILLQFRALGVPVFEVALQEGHPGDGTGSDTLGDAVGSVAAAIAYRLHQVHATRDGRFLVDHDIHYTLKLSETGSHMQIVAAIEPNSHVLDLGCSQGLLARPLLEKNVRVTGVDVGSDERLASELAEYHQRDLEEPLELPCGRDFDYVVCADVIEHLNNRMQLLQSSRRYLKPAGRLIISTPNIALWFYRLSLAAGRFEYGPRGVLDETHVHLFTGSTFRRQVEKAGFVVVRQRVTALPFEIVFESTGRSRLVRAMATTYHVLAQIWPSMFAYQYVLEAEITTLGEESTRPSGQDLR